MPIVIFVLLVLLVANIGFWKTLGSVLGAIGVIVLLVVILALLALACASYFWGRVKRRL